MNRGFELIRMEAPGDPEGKLYTVWFFGQEITEYEKFKERPRVSGQTFEDMEDTLTKMIDDLGFRKHLFKTEDYNEPECAYYKERLRMYCLRYSSSVLVAGSGGYKPRTKNGEDIERLQEVPYLKRAFQSMQYVRKRIQRRLNILRPGAPPQVRRNCLRLTAEAFLGPDDAFVFEPH